MLSGSHSVCVSNDILTFSNLYGAIKAEILFKYCSLLDLLLDDVSLFSFRSAHNEEGFNVLLLPHVVHPGSAVVKPVRETARPGVLKNEELCRSAPAGIEAQVVRLQEDGIVARKEERRNASRHVWTPAFDYGSFVFVGIVKRESHLSIDRSGVDGDFRFCFNFARTSGIFFKVDAIRMDRSNWHNLDSLL